PADLVINLVGRTRLERPGENPGVVKMGRAILGRESRDRPDRDHDRQQQPGHEQPAGPETLPRTEVGRRWFAAFGPIEGRGIRGLCHQSSFPLRVPCGSGPGLVTATRGYWVISRIGASGSHFANPSTLRNGRAEFKGKDAKNAPQLERELC